MKVAKLYSFNDIRIEDMPVPEVGPRDALMRTMASGICSGDVMPWYIEKKAPLVLGHEPAGVIVEAGSEVHSFRPGDRVFAHHHAPCMRCRHCLRGDFVHCSTWKETRLLPGGISEYVLIPEVNLINDTLLLPDNLGYEDGALIEPLACAVKGLRRAGIRQGDTVFVIGLGAMGLMNVMAARSYGASTVIGADMVPYRLKKAGWFADHVIDASKENSTGRLSELTGGGMADLVIVGPGSVDALNAGLASAGPGGRVLMFTPVGPDERLTLDPNELYFRDVSLVASYSCGPDDTAEALRLIEEGAVRATDIITNRFPIQDTEKAFRLTARAGDSLKCIIVFE